MNEFDELEDIYFGKKGVADPKEQAKLTGLYLYCQLLKLPSKPSLHVPYNLLTYLARVAPKGSETEYIVEKLVDYGYVKPSQAVPDDLKRRIEYALNWTRDFREIRERAIKLSEQEVNVVKELIQTLRAEVDENQIQSAIFNIARKNKVPPRQFFKTLYTIFLGVSEGPRLGPYIVAMGRENVINALKRVLMKY